MKTEPRQKQAALRAVLIVCSLMLGAFSAHGQESPSEAPAPATSPPAEEAKPEVTADDASLTAEVNEEGGRIVVEAKGVRPKVPMLFSAEARETVEIQEGKVGYQFAIALKTIQGKGRHFSLGLGGAGELLSVSGEGLLAWSVRRVGADRFLDLEMTEDADRKDYNVVVQAQIGKLELPASPDLMHLKAGKAVGFVSSVEVKFPVNISSRLVAADGFLPLESADDQVKRFEGSLGKRLAFALSRSSAVSAPVELVNAWLEGTVNENDGYASFMLRATAEVSKDDVAINVLRGRAAASEVPAAAGYRLELAADESNRPVYRLRFPKAGSFPVELKIVARLSESDDWRNLDFEVPSGAIVPIVLRGIVGDTEFRENGAVIPTREGEAWRGFLPLHGRCDLGWKPARTTGEGKLFFTTSAKVNVGVGAGVLRQTSIIEFKILQGQLQTISLTLEGEGDVHDVDGPNIVGWTPVTEDGVRRLEVQLSRPIENEGLLRVRSQLPLDAFPVRAKPLRLVPSGSIRHSGYIRVYNIGATRLEVAGITGLTQLSPDQFPEQNLPGGDRQAFVYRFPAATHDYEIAADRVQPEVHVLQNMVYELAEAERTINADVELDIREAPLREWQMTIPGDYTIISVSGAEVRDYVRGSEVTDNERSMSVLFSKEVMGRQLIKIHLEKNLAAASGQWTLPRLSHADAKSVRGEIGLAGVPGYRLSVENSEKLTEIPISRFQKNMPGLRLQQAFRIRERDWSAAVKIEELPQSVQADVFHLYSLKDETAYVSVILNYFITGAPVSEFRIAIPESLVKEEDGDFGTAGNLTVICNDLRQEKVVVTTGEGGERKNEYVLTLQKGVIGPVTLLVTFELSLAAAEGAQAMVNLGEVAPMNVASERGFIQVVSPVQVNAPIDDEAVPDGLLKLNPLELPAEFQLLSPAPPIATYQYSGSSRPFSFPVPVNWYESGDTIEQVVEFMNAKTQVSRVGGVVTKVNMRVKTRGRRVLRTELPTQAELWEVRVNGKLVTARTDVQDDGKAGQKVYHLIPLPADVDINTPVTVELEVGKPADRGKDKYPELTLPSIHAPVSKADWEISGEQGRILIPRKSSIPLHERISPETGLEWIAHRAIGATLVLFILLCAGLWLRCAPSGRNLWFSLGGIAVLIVALVVSLALMSESRQVQRPPVEVLNFSLPVIAADQPPTMVVANLTNWGARVNTLGVLALVVGVALVGWSVVASQRRYALRIAGGAMLSVGLLMQGGGASIFYLVVAIVIAMLLLPWLVRWWGQFQAECATWEKERREQAEARRAAEESADQKEEESSSGGDSEGPLPGPAATLLLFGVFLSLGMAEGVDAQNAKQASPPPVVIPAGIQAADHVAQEWSIADGRLKAAGEVKVTGEPGDSFLLLRAPGVLTDFKGDGLRITKRDIPGMGASYVVSIRGSEGGGNDVRSFAGTFGYEMQVGNNADRFVVPTGASAVQSVKVHYDQTGWEFDSTAAMRVTVLEEEPGSGSGAELLLAPLAAAEIVRRPKVRDVKAEKTQFYSEAANLFLPSPGVVDGIHRIGVRPSKGEVRELQLTVPQGFTATDVPAGPVGEWQFDADSRLLKVVIEPAQARPFSILVTTQSSLSPLPADATLAPVVVNGSSGEVGLVALAFGPEAQPEKAEPEGMSAVNLTDFDASLLPERRGGKPVLHRVFRYGQAGGSLALRVAPVAPELRVSSKQVLFIRDERMELSINFDVDISRAGLFQMSFPLPEGLEVDSLSSPSLRHWTELTEEGVRHIIMHLNGKTIGKHQFSLSLSGAAPDAGAENWLVPRFELKEAQRHTGTLVIRPTTGVRLESTLERNVSDVDPREIGGQGSGALGFRLLQSDWELRLGVTKDQPRVTADVLHTLTLREEQTQTSILARVTVERASIRSLRIQLPELDAETNSLRASGSSVNDLLQVVDDSGNPVKGLYEIQFKRRVLGPLKPIRINWERTGERPDGIEQVRMVSFPTADRNSQYNLAIRAGAMLDLKDRGLPKGWQKGEWGAVSKILREAGDQSAPALVFKCKATTSPFELVVRRHSVADALKLRVVKGEITTVISPVARPIGKHLTRVDLDFEVIQRSALNLRLPQDGELLNVIVNGESVSLVRVEGAYQFYILPGPEGRTARVQFVYSTPGQKMGDLDLESPKLNVPLEKIDWRVIVPEDYDLVKSDGDLDFREVRVGEDYTLERYVAKNEEERREQRRFADDSIDRANELLTAGEQAKAGVLFNSAANNYALDAATNEDARVQSRKIQQQQVIVALNTRRHRLLRDNQTDDQGSFEANDELERAALLNPLVNHGDLRFNQEQYSAITQGNTDADAANLGSIAGQVVVHQRSIEQVPKTIRVAIPDEGKIFTFSRSVQVEKDAPLSLELKFQAPQIRDTSREALVLLLVLGICVALVFGWKRKTAS